MNPYRKPGTGESAERNPRTLEEEIELRLRRGAPFERYVLISPIVLRSAARRMYAKVYFWRCEPGNATGTYALELITPFGQVFAIADPDCPIDVFEWRDDVPGAAESNL